MPHITQIAAVESKSNSVFNVYVQPKVPQTFEAQEKTGIVASDSGSMTVNGVNVTPSSISNASDEFIKWIGKYNNPFLIAHNSRRFDFPVTMSILKNIGFELSACGFIDSLPIF